MEKTSLLFASEFSYFFARLLLSRSFSISLFFLEGARSLSLSLRAKDTSSIATRPFSLSPSLARFPAASKRQKQLVPRPSNKREKVRTRCSLATEKKKELEFSNEHLCSPLPPARRRARLLYSPPATREVVFPPVALSQEGETESRGAGKTVKKESFILPSFFLLSSLARCSSCALAEKQQRGPSFFFNPDLLRPRCFSFSLTVHFPPTPLALPLSIYIYIPNPTSTEREKRTSRRKRKCSSGE